MPRSLSLRLVFCMCWSALLSSAQEIVYVTDLAIFTDLAPCAASAVSYYIQSQTYENCPEAVTELQSCACTKNNNFASISTAISSEVSASCGSTASEDQASAASVFQAYCTQDGITPFPQPTVAVTQYVTDLPAWEQLAPCAASGLSEIVQAMTYSLCPSEPSLLATCVCSKNQNSLLASQGINTSVKYSCSSKTQDIASAQAVFAGYCGLVDGTTSFPETTDPPGDMTYYVTALPDFSSLAPCAQSAVSYGILSQTYDLCPEGPKALASCACLRDDMTALISSIIRSDVRYSCESTASEDVTSALSVYDLYCNAAKGLVSPLGITESVPQTTPTGSIGDSGPKQTGESGSGPTGSASNDPNNDVDQDGMNSDSSAAPNVGLIAGVVVGAVSGIALIGAIVFFLWRHKRQRQHRDQIAAAALASSEQDFDIGGKPELDGVALIQQPPGASKSPSTLSASVVPRSNSVSPVSGHASPQHSLGPYPPPLPRPEVSELHGRNIYARTQELHAQSTAYSTHSPVSPQTPQEVYGRQVYEAPGPHPWHVQAYGGPDQPRSELQG